MGNGKNEVISAALNPIPTTLNVGPGSIIHVGDTVFCVKRFETSESVIARSIDTGLDQSIKFSEISESCAKHAQGRKIDLSAISDEDWDVAIERYKVLQPLLENTQRTAQDVLKVATEQLVSVATMYRWLDRLALSGTVTCLLRKKRNDAGNKNLDPLIEAIVKNVIANEYLTKLKRSPTLALKEIKRRCRLSNYTAPCKSTLLRRIDEILPEERERRRNGRNAALDYRAERGSMPGIDRLHAIWQIDHTLVDVILVDERDRIPIGRPWITLAMDVFSRTVVGWYVSFDPPGALGTGICISNAILPKDTFLARLGVNYPWPCQGKPRIIQADNAKEFRGNMLKNACNEHGFEMKFRKVKKPNYGAHIERILGTLLAQIHGLDGTTFSNPQEKGEYDSEGNAAMTLDDFELWLANLILGPYHHGNHLALGCSPIKRYRDGIFGDENTPGIGMLPIAADPEKLKIDFLPL
ncbi:MAG: DDE-type integrase/transposase/recombinase, partial [Gallionella sp.]|nr:DDE-type integrase/transposase/recombinase [Gallionella sp.]